MITATRYHDISCGHRVAGHENKCAALHGHNYRVHFTCSRPFALDAVGRVLDFSVMKERLCMWLENEWDHKFLVWDQDHIVDALLDAMSTWIEIHKLVTNSIVKVPFNPTAENMARYLLDHIGPRVLEGTGCELVEVTVEETRKCSATAK